MEVFWIVYLYLNKSLIDDSSEIHSLEIVCLTAFRLIQFALRLFTLWAVRLTAMLIPYVDFHGNQH
jgi:hypothetical protein